MKRLVHRMTELAPLKEEELHFAYELDGFDESFESWKARLCGPAWQRFGLFREGVLVGCLTAELVNATTCGIHIAIKRRQVKSIDVARVVIGLGVTLFRSGFQSLRANGRSRAGRCLAIRCGMTRNTGDQFELTAQEYFANPERWEI